jgi:hypothetical protein
MKRKFIIATLLCILCFSFSLSGCLVTTALFAVVERTSIALDELGEFTNIDIDTQNTNVRFEVSDENTLTLTEFKGHEHNIEIADGCLTIKQDKPVEWYETIVNHTKTFIVIGLSKEQYDTLNLKGTTSDVKIDCAVTFNSVNVEIEKGDATFKDCNVNGKVTVKVDNGNVIAQNFDALNTEITTNTGNITLEFLTDKTVTATTTGTVTNTCPLGSECILTSTGGGNIEVVIKE